MSTRVRRLQVTACHGRSGHSSFLGPSGGSPSPPRLPRRNFLPAQRAKNSRGTFVRTRGDVPPRKSPGPLAAAQFAPSAFAGFRDGRGRDPEDRAVAAHAGSDGLDRGDVDLRVRRGVWQRCPRAPPPGRRPGSRSMFSSRRSASSFSSRPRAAPPASSGTEIDLRLAPGREAAQREQVHAVPFSAASSRAPSPGRSGAGARSNRVYGRCRAWSLLLVGDRRRRGYPWSGNRATRSAVARDERGEALLVPASVPRGAGGSTM